MTNRRIYQVILWIAGLWLVVDLASRLAAEILWFQEVGYLQVLLLRLKTQGLLGIIPTAISAVFLMGNLTLARRLQHPFEETQAPISEASFASVNLKKIEKNYQIPPVKSQITFTWILLAVFGLSSIAILTIIYCGYLAANSLTYFGTSGNLPALPVQFG
ncbi:hypothetical protein C7B69_23515, partial [filamentous cyanobacterium Phorm 46]